MGNVEFNKELDFFAFEQFEDKVFRYKEQDDIRKSDLETFKKNSKKSRSVQSQKSYVNQRKYKVRENKRKNYFIKNGKILKGYRNPVRMRFNPETFSLYFVPEQYSTSKYYKRKGNKRVRFLEKINHKNLTPQYKKLYQRHYNLDNF